jgi:hypothetical protein
MLFSAFHRAIGAGEKRPSSHSRSRLRGTSPFFRGGCVSPDAIVLVLARSRRPVRHVGRLSIAVLRRFRLSCDRKQLGIAAWAACLPPSDHLARLATARTTEHADSDVSDPEQRQLVCFPDPAHTEKASSVSDRCSIRNVRRNRHDAGVDWDADRKKFHRPLPILFPIRRVFTATWTITHSLTLSHLAR